MKRIPLHRRLSDRLKAGRDISVQQFRALLQAVDSAWYDPRPAERANSAVQQGAPAGETSSRGHIFLSVCLSNEVLGGSNSRHTEEALIGFARGNCDLLATLVQAFQQFPSSFATYQPILLRLLKTNLLQMEKFRSESFRGGETSAAFRSACDSLQARFHGLIAEVHELERLHHEQFAGLPPSFQCQLCGQSVP